MATAPDSFIDGFFYSGFKRIREVLLSLFTVPDDVSFEPFCSKSAE